MNKYNRIVVVEWDDHAFQQGEVILDELELSVQRTVGWFLEEDEKTIKIAQSIQDDTRPCEVIVIDKRMMRRKRFLK